MKRQFSVRVYAIIDAEDKSRILASREFYKGMEMIKFPGGGLEWGEGIVDGLRRELKEELGVVNFEAQQLMVYEKPVISVFNPDIAVISVYYRVIPRENVKITNGDILELITIPKTEEGINSLTFENDRHAFRYFLLQDTLS